MSINQTRWNAFIINPAVQNFVEIANHRPESVTAMSSFILALKSASDYVLWIAHILSRLNTHTCLIMYARKKVSSQR